MSGKPFVLGDILNPDFADTSNTPAIAKQSPLAMLAQACNNIGKELNADALSTCDSKKAAVAVRPKAKETGRNFCFATPSECSAQERGAVLQSVPDELCNPLAGLETFAASLQQLRGSPNANANARFSALGQSVGPMSQCAADASQLANAYQTWWNFLLSMQSRAHANNNYLSYPDSRTLANSASLTRPPTLSHTDYCQSTLSSTCNSIASDSLNSATIMNYLAAFSQLQQLKSPSFNECASNQSCPACLAYSYQLQHPQMAHLASTMLKLEHTATGCSAAHVCNWMVPGNENRSRTFCGARFLTGEQLMQHLKLHIAEDQGDGDRRSAEERRRAIKRPKGISDDELDAAVPKSIRSETVCRKLREAGDSKCFASPSASTESDK